MWLNSWGWETSKTLPCCLVAGQPQGSPPQDISHHHLQLFSNRRRRTEMFLTFNLFQTFTIPSETSTTWQTIHHREELRQPQPRPGRQPRREVEGSLRSIIFLIIINFDTWRDINIQPSPCLEPALLSNIRTWGFYLTEGGHDQHHYLPLQQQLQQRPPPPLQHPQLQQRQQESRNITNMTTTTMTSVVTM